MPQRAGPYSFEAGSVFPALAKSVSEIAVRPAARAMSAKRRDLLP